METKFYRDAEDYVGVYTFPSRRRTILYHSTPYSLLFPEMNFFIGFTKDVFSMFIYRCLYISGSEGRILALPHQTNQGRVCLKNNLNYYASNVHMKGLCDTVLDYYWQSNFLDHFGDCSFSNFKFLNSLKTGLVVYENFRFVSDIVRNKRLISI